MRNRSHLPTFFDADVRPSQLDNLTGQPSPLEVWNITYLHFHALLELGVCMEGEGTCIVQGVSQPFCAGDVQIIFPFQRHLSRSEGGRHSLWHWISINPLQLMSRWPAPDLARLERLLNTRMGLCGIIDRQAHPLAAELIRRVTLPGPRDVRLSSLHALIEVLAQESEGLPPLDLRPEQSFERLQPALMRVKCALDDGYSPALDELCAESCMSPASLRRSFHQLLGLSPQQYIQTCQMRRAQQLLLTTDESITQIALAVGYQDASGFNRLFLRTFGMPPRAYRGASAQP